MHAHWTPVEFRHKTRLPKLADRILVVIDTDALPLPLRTSLFTADRTELLRNSDAVRLEEELIAFVDDWEELWRANNDLIRDAIRRSNADRSTAAVATRISRALSLKGGKGTAAGDSDRVRRDRPVRAPRELRDEPTEVLGPDEVVAVRGRTKGAYFSVNAVDDFIPRSAEALVTCDHLDIDPATDITIGRLRGGKIRVAIAVPPDAEIAAAQLTLRVSPWIARSGGRKGPLELKSRLRVVEAKDGLDAGSERSAAGAPGAGRVALVWTSHDAEENWTSQTVGEVERIDADSLAEAASDYAALAGSHFEVLLVKLNEEFGPLKAYTALRAHEVGDEGVARAKDRYAVGVGVDMLVLDQHVTVLAKQGLPVDEAWVEAGRVAAARGILAVMPDYDRLAAETGVEGI